MEINSNGCFPGRIMFFLNWFSSRYLVNNLEVGGQVVIVSQFQRKDFDALEV